MTVYKMILRRCKTINVVYTASDRNQASVERRRPRRLGPLMLSSSLGPAVNCT